MKWNETLYINGNDTKRRNEKFINAINRSHDWNTNWKMCIECSINAIKCDRVGHEWMCSRICGTILADKQQHDGKFRIERNLMYTKDPVFLLFKSMMAIEKMCSLIKWVCRSIYAVFVLIVWCRFWAFCAAIGLMAYRQCGEEENNEDDDIETTKTRVKQCE